MNFSASAGSTSTMSPAMTMVFWIVYLAVIVLMIAAFWKIFVKAGQPGWAAIIPIYNAYIILKVAGKPGWWLILLLIPLVNLIVLIIVYHAISTAFGKGAGFTLGIIFFPYIFLPILGFGKAVYTKPMTS
jgi:hypothetical protein